MGKLCGIVGYTNIRGNPDPTGFITLIEQSNIRGIHAFGLATNKGQVFRSLKPFSASELRDTLRSCPAWLYHNRYSTSGDWLEMNNNQPVTREGASLVMNGVISMEPAERWKKEYGGTYSTENDAEILLAKLLDNENIEGWLKTTKASVAALFLKDGQVYAMRNLKRPLRYIQTDTGILVASTADLFRRAGYSGEVRNIPPFINMNLRDLWIHG